MMGSGAEVAEEAMDASERRGRKSRPAESAAVPAVLHRAFRRGPAGLREDHRGPRPHQGAGRSGEPLYLDVITALSEAMVTGKRVIGGRYGLSSKEFTPAMVKGVFDELLKPKPKNHFTVGIMDDVAHTSLDYDPAFSTEVARHGARAVLRPGRGRHGGRQQELHQDHRRGNRQLTRRATSFTTRRNPAPSRFRTCASGRSRCIPAT